MTAAPDPLLLDDRWRQAQRQQPFFCEENVWQLLQTDDLPRPRAALFVTNRDRCVAMWGQRSAEADPVLWDYHVVLLLPHHGVVVDLDDRDRPGRRVREWLAHAFRSPRPALQPRFRVVPDAEFLAVFSSDRSHMRDRRHRPLRPFPPWPAPLQPARGSNLLRFVDLDDPIGGVVTDAAGLIALAPA